MRCNINREREKQRERILLVSRWKCGTERTRVTKKEREGGGLDLGEHSAYICVFRKVSTFVVAWGYMKKERARISESKEEREQQPGCI